MRDRVRSTQRWPSSHGECRSIKVSALKGNLESGNVVHRSLRKWELFDSSVKCGSEASSEKKQKKEWRGVPGWRRCDRYGQLGKPLKSLTTTARWRWSWPFQFEAHCSVCLCLGYGARSHLLSWSLWSHEHPSLGLDEARLLASFHLFLQSNTRNWPELQCVEYQMQSLDRWVECSVTICCVSIEPYSNHTLTSYCTGALLFGLRSIRWRNRVDAVWISYEIWYQAEYLDLWKLHKKHCEARTLFQRAAECTFPRDFRPWLHPLIACLLSRHVLWLKSRFNGEELASISFGHVSKHHLTMRDEDSRAFSCNRDGRHVDLRRGSPKSKAMMMGLIVVLAFFREIVNGSVFSPLAHVHPSSKGSLTLLGQF